MLDLSAQLGLSHVCKLEFPELKMFQKDITQNNKLLQINSDLQYS